MAQSIKQQGFNLDVDALAEGLKDALNGSAPKISPEDMKTVIRAFQQNEMQKRQKSGLQNTEVETQFLATNKTKPGIIETASGLQYQVLRPGKGAKPTMDNTVEVHYRGTLLNGEQFDSSYDRGQTASFKLNGIVPGWQEALQLMNAGAKWKIFVPSKLGYGARGRPPKIGPNAALIFDIELISVK